MTRTFLVALVVDDDADLTSIAEDLQIILSESDYTVASVKPWSSSQLTQETLQPFTLPTASPYINQL